MLSLTASLTKDKVFDTGVWLVLITITLPDTTVFRIVNNNENVTWPFPSGDIYSAFPFDFPDLAQTTKTEQKTINLTISNKNLIFQELFDVNAGGVGSSINISVVHSAFLANPNPHFTIDLQVLSASADNENLVFSMGTPNPFKKRYPLNRVYPVCRFKYKDSRCAATSILTTCDQTVENCTERDNLPRFGGFPLAGLVRLI